MNHFTIKNIYIDIYGIGEFNTDEKVISYLIIGDTFAVLFDTGLGLCSMKKCIEKITNLPIVVINSHSHYDHIGSNHEFKNIKMFNHDMSILSQKGLSSFDLINKSYDTPEKFENGDAYFIKPFVCEEFLLNGSIINVGRYSFEIINVPGHSPDSIAMYDKNYKILFSGDLVYDGGIYLQLPESSIDDYKNSISKLSKLSYNIIFGSHNNFSCRNDIFSILHAYLQKPIISGKTHIIDNIYIYK